MQSIALSRRGLGNCQEKPRGDFAKRPPTGSTHMPPGAGSMGHELEARSSCPIAVADSAWAPKCGLTLKQEAYLETGA